MKKYAFCLSAACLIGSNVWAQDQTYDARSLAMGGAGAATANARNAAFLNPAAAAGEKDKFALEFPIVSARFLDANSLQKDADTLSTNANNLTNALTSFQNAMTALQANPTTANATAVQSASSTAGTALTNFNTSLNTVSGKSLTGGLFAGALLAVPGSTLGVALMVDGRAELGGQFNYAAADNSTVTNLASAMNSCGAATGTATQIATACQTAANSVGTGGQVTGLQSQLLVRGVVSKDVGITLAHHFDVWDGVDIGVTPKFTQLRTFDIASSAQSGNGVSTSYGANSENSSSVFNMDVGALKTLSRNGDSEIKVAVVVKDLMSKNVKTVLGNDITIKPRATVGVGYVTDLVSANVDVDVITNKQMIAGFGADSQFIRLGAEFDAWKWAQVRVGYRHDLKGNYKGLPSLGLGLSPFGVHLDLSVAAAAKNEVAAALQTGFHF
ncbi:MAG: conjugal transfer protein TraF [Pseudomonadota bacterium]